MAAPTSPFSCTYSPQLPELLNRLNITLALSTFQAGKLVFFSAVDDEKLIQLPRTFDKPMGVAVKDDFMAVATRDEIIVLRDDPRLAEFYPNKPGVYDALYVPRQTFYPGMVDIHDLAWGENGLIAVNTSFSCISAINENFSFMPVWKPNFISALKSEDRCHLNGMALLDGRPKYVSALGKTDEMQGWRSSLPKGGILIDAGSGEIILDDLPMPHSPRIYKNNLYLLFSATGELAKIHPEKGEVEIIKKLEGFVRGMAIHEDYAFIGLSKLRKNSSTFKDLPIADKARSSGIAVVHLPTGAFVGEIKYHASLDEIYDVQVLPGKKRPGILNTSAETYKLALSTPAAAFWGKKAEG